MLPRALVPNGAIRFWPVSGPCPTRSTGSVKLTQLVRTRKKAHSDGTRISESSLRKLMERENFHFLFRTKKLTQLARINVPRTIGYVSIPIVPYEMTAAKDDKANPNSSEDASKNGKRR